MMFLTAPCWATLELNPRAVESDGRSKVSIALDTLVKTDEGRLSVVIRSTKARETVDVSTLASVKDNAVEIDLTAFPLASGQYTVDVYLDPRGGEPTPTSTRVSRATLNVASKASAARNAYVFTFTPTLELGVKTQVLERTEMGAKPSARPHYADLTIQGGIDTGFVGSDWDAKVRAQYVGSSVRSEATTFGSDSVRAAKINIQDYLFDAGWRDTRVQLGAISTSIQPTLASSISNRGVAFAHRLPFGLEITGATQSSIGVVGFDNFSGLSNERAQSRSLNFGYDFIAANPGQTRLDFAFFDGKRPNDSATLGTPIEESNGIGGRFLWRNAKGDIRTEWTFAQSSHATTKPEGGIKKDAGHAYTAEAGYDILKDRDFAGSKLAITTAARLEHSSPFYRSLGASFVSNYQTTSELIGFQLGSAQLQLQGIQRFDNVGADRAYIRNRVDARLINLNLPSDVMYGAYRSWFKSATDKNDKPSSWIPAFSLSHNVYNGFGDRRFVPEGFTETDLPHVISSNSAMGLAWRFEQISFNWKGTLTRERNLQIGDEKTSTRNVRHSFSLDYNPTPTISFGASLDRGVGERLDDPALKLAAAISARASWKVNDKNDLSFDFNRSRDYDSIYSKNAVSRRAQLQWTSRYDVPVWMMAKPLPLRTYVRALASDNYNWAIGATNVTSPRIWAIQLGGTVSFF